MPNNTNESNNSNTRIVSLANNSDSFRERYQSLAGTLMQKLQTTLEIEEILQIFAEEARHVVAFQRFTYHHTHCHLELGEEPNPGRHELDYQLSLQGSNLGRIRVRRSYRFQDVEMEAFESLVGSLIYPLRNASLYREAQRAALTDSLTGAANKRAFDYQIQRDISLARRYQQPLSLLLLDIDHFKQINDTHGHAAGDAVLRSVVEVIKRCCRDSDTVFRYGGEEFAVALPKANMTDGLIIAERIRNAVEDSGFQYQGTPIAVTLSIGCATHQDAESSNTLLERADQALYRAKRSGRNRTCVDGDSVMTEDAVSA